MDRIERIDKYADAWTQTQLDIWTEKVRRLKIIRTGDFHGSFGSRVSAVSDGNTIEMMFLKYGLFQEFGTGNGYVRGEANGGDLEFLDPKYREEHGLNRPRRAGSPPGYMTSGHPRERREWFSKKLYMSYRAMVEDLSSILSEEGVNIICSALEDDRALLR